MERAYLDSAAAHPVRPRALRAFMRAQKFYGNPSAPHEEGRKALAVLEDARTRIARILGAKPDAVIFTSGATESNALAIVGHIRARIEAGALPENLEIIYSETQHASVLGAVEEVRNLGVGVHTLPLKDGGIDLESLSVLLSKKTVLVTTDVICGETGTRFDTRGIRVLLDHMPAGERPVLHVDATQAPLVENMDRTRLGADLITFDAQKIGGVRGIGALIAPRSLVLSPLTGGGGQERGLRSGTPSPSLASAFALALEEAGKEREAFVKRGASMTDALMNDIVAAFPKAVRNGGKMRAPHILNVSFPGIDTDYLAALLDEAGIAVATRSACETDAEGSRVVLAYTGDAARTGATLRISLSARTRASELKVFMNALKKSLPLAKAD